jgi:hypothetical protein
MPNVEELMEIKIPENQLVNRSGSQVEDYEPSLKP